MARAGTYQSLGARGGRVARQRHLRVLTQRAWGVIDGDTRTSSRELDYVAGEFFGSTLRQAWRRWYDETSGVTRAGRYFESLTRTYRLQRAQGQRPDPPRREGLPHGRPRGK